MTYGISRRRLLELLGAAGVSTAVGSTTTASSDTGSGSPSRRATPLAKAPLGPDQIAVDTPQGSRSLPHLAHTAVDTPLARSTRRDAGRLETAQSSSGELRAEVLVSTRDHGVLDAGDDMSNSSVPADVTLNIWAGRSSREGFSDPPTPGSGESLPVRVEKPDGSSDTLSIQPGEFGAGQTTYDLGEHSAGEGVYRVTIDEDDEGVPDDPSFRSPWETKFVVGPVVTLATSLGFDAFCLRGRETRIPVLARVGTAPAADIEATVRLEHDGGTVREETVTTDTDGVASITIVPESPGDYALLLERDGEVVDEQEFETVEAVFVGPNVTSGAYTGVENFFGGYLSEESGLLRETAFTFRIESEQTTVVDQQVETDQNGFATIAYNVPADIDEANSFQSVDIKATLDGDPVPVIPGSIGVSGDDQESPFERELLDVTIDSPTDASSAFGQSVLAPGDEPTVTISAEDEEGNPVQDAPVEVVAHSSLVVFDAGSVTTDSEGTASLTMPVPEQPPNGPEFTVTAATEVDGQTQTGRSSGSLRRTQLNALVEAFDFEPFLPAPGETRSVTFQATDLRTGSPVEGQHRHLGFHHDSALRGAFAVLHQTTGTGGTDDTPLAVPEDSQFSAEYEPYDVYNRGNLRLSLTVDHPGDLEMPDPVTPGETVEVSLNTPSDETATGFVSIANWDPGYSFGTAVTSDEPATLGIPDTVDDSFPSTPPFDALFGDQEPFLPVVAMAATPDGTLYGSRWQLHVTDTDDGTGNGSDDGTGEDGDGTGNGSDDGTGEDGDGTGNGSDDGTGEDGDGTGNGDGDGSDDGTDGDGSGDGFGPGFDVSGALASLGAIGYLLKRRLDSGTTPEPDKSDD